MNPLLTIILLEKKFYAGPFLGFSGSLITHEKIHIDILAPILPLCWQQHDINMRKMVARFFGAFNRAIQKLKNYYENVLPTLQQNPIQPLPAFPYKRAYKSLQNNAIVYFNYEEQSMTDKLVRQTIVQSNLR